MELLLFQILFATIVALITVMINMKIKHEKELEHHIKDYWKVEEELFKCELKLIKKENEE